MGGLSNEYLDKVIRERLEATHVVINDQSGGCGQAFEVTIVSDKFAGKNKLMRHKLVNKALQEEIASIHAFTQVSCCINVYVNWDELLIIRFCTGW